MLSSRLTRSDANAYILNQICVIIRVLEKQFPCLFCREMCSDFMSHLRFAASTIMALHEATEAYIVGTFKDANLCAIDAKRVTVMPKSFHLVRLPHALLNVASNGININHSALQLQMQTKAAIRMSFPAFVYFLSCSQRCNPNWKFAVGVNHRQLQPRRLGRRHRLTSGLCDAP